MKLVKNRTLMRTPCSCRLSCFCLNSNNFTGFVISNDNISITGEQHFRAVRLLFAIQPHSRPPGRRLFHHLCPAAVRTFRRSPPRQVILRLPPHITLTPVNLTVQVVALVFRQLKNMLSVAQLRFQQVTAAVVKVFNPPPVRQRGGQQVAQRVVFMFMLSSTALFGNQQATTVIFQPEFIIRLRLPLFRLCPRQLSMPEPVAISCFTDYWPKKIQNVKPVYYELL
ncbi:hypothetical protein [Salmonella enterica]|uniref:hypothetical protein n=1 Tax=Salmonella enterica TaxID=28901 RepID=UPI00217D70B9|nr:hypothetical protein [Salmonella enterica]